MSAQGRSKDHSPQSIPTSSEAAPPTPDLTSGQGNAALAASVGASAEEGTPSLDAASRGPIGPVKTSKIEPGTESHLGGSGDLMVAAATDANHLAQDTESYTQRLLAIQKEHPEMSLDDVMREVNLANIWGRGSQLAETAGATTSDGEVGERYGLVVGNSNYDKLPRLDGAAADAAGMASTWSAQGYAIDQQSDLPVADLTSAFREAPAGLQSGDELLMYYAGHGLKSGLGGTDLDLGNPDAGVMPQTVLSGIARASEGKGIKTRLIVDSCHAGALIDEMHHKEIEADVTSRSMAVAADQEPGETGGVA